MLTIDTELYKKVLKTSEISRFAVLATEKNEEPHLSLVGFLLDEDLKNLYFYTPVNSRKYKNIIISPSVALLIDSREEYANQAELIISVTIIGKASEIEKPGKKFLDKYLYRYPELKNFTGMDINALIKVNILKYIIVDNFSKISEIIMH